MRGRGVDVSKTLFYLTQWCYLDDMRMTFFVILLKSLYKFRHNNFQEGERHEKGEIIAWS